MSVGNRWTLDEYVLRCEQRQDLREILVEGELDRAVVTDALARWGATDVNVLDAGYLAVDPDAIESHGFNRGVKGELLTVAAVLDASDRAAEVGGRIAVVVDRDYDDAPTSDGCLFVTDGHSVESYALNPDALSRFASLVLGRDPLPAGPSGTAPERRNYCSGDDLYVRVVSPLTRVAGVRIALRTIDPPLGVFDSWIDYLTIDADGLIESRISQLIRNVLEQKGRGDEREAVEQSSNEAAGGAASDPFRLVRGRDFPEMLGKLLNSRWGRSRGGAAVAKDLKALSRLLLLAVDPATIDSTAMMSGLRAHFSPETG